jgi:hypothetical protein
MTEMKRRAPKKGWEHFTWCYRESMAEGGWLSKASVERKKQDVTEYMWFNEYENQEPSPASRAIMPDKVDLMFNVALGEYSGTELDYMEFEPPVGFCPSKPCHQKQGEVYETERLSEREKKALKDKLIKLEKQEPTDVIEIKIQELKLKLKPLTCAHCGSLLKDAEYATGADWAKKTDWTIIMTWRIDCSPMRMVAYYRGGRQPWGIMVEEFDAQIERYDSSAAHDATGLGDVVGDMARNPAEEIIMVGRDRKDLLSDYVGAVERSEIICPKIEYMYDEHRFCSVDDLHGSGHPPDTIVAGAMTYVAAGYGGSLAIPI